MQTWRATVSGATYAEPRFRFLVIPVDRYESSEQVPYVCERKHGWTFPRRALQHSSSEQAGPHEQPEAQPDAPDDNVWQVLVEKKTVLLILRRLRFS